MEKNNSHSPLQELNHAHCIKVMEYVEQCFGDVLDFAFICGSRASRKFNKRSDIDIFVVLQDSVSFEMELAFYKLFVEYHNKNDLHHDHCGEILHRSTLDYLLDLCSRTIRDIPVIRRSCCYSCLFSGFRKGHVILGMLDGAKWMKKGDLDTISSYSRSAQEYARFEAEIESRTEKDIAPQKCPQQNRNYYQKWVQTNIDKKVDYSWTPVGVGLDRWFCEVHPQGSINSTDSLLEQCVLETAIRKHEQKSLFSEEQ